jgi:hypothetical protein
LRKEVDLEGKLKMSQGIILEATRAYSRRARSAAAAPAKTVFTTWTWDPTT